MITESDCGELIPRNGISQLVYRYDWEINARPTSQIGHERNLDFAALPLIYVEDSLYLAAFNGEGFILLENCESRTADTGTRISYQYYDLLDHEIDFFYI